jgi:ribosomal-protein-alanine N-acetyltransferase
MNFNQRLGGFPIIETERLRLRELRPDQDAPARHAIWSDPESMRYIPDPLSPSVQDSAKVLSWLRARFYDAHILAWAITLKGKEQFIGGIRYIDFTRHNYMAGEVGYELAREYRNRGLMTEALTAVVRFGLSRIGLNRVQLTTHPENHASRRVALKAGFVEEGVLHWWQYNERSNTWDDQVMFGILRPDGQPRTKWLI